MKLSKKEAIRNHRVVWDWLYRHPSPKRQKEDWPGWEENGGNIPYVKAWCFPCEYIYNNKIRCCILEWPVYPCLQYGSPYWNWYRAKTWQERKKYAKLIRDLPERK